MRTTKQSTMNPHTLPLLAAAICLTGASQAALTITSAAGTDGNNSGFPSGALISNPSDFASSTVVNTNNARGQSFNLSSESNISSITLQLEGEAGDDWDPVGSLTLEIFNVTGSGGSTAFSGAALFSDSGTLPSGLGAPGGYNDFLTLTLASP